MDVIIVIVVGNVDMTTRSLRLGLTLSIAEAVHIDA
jgi:hypothetical protein